MTINFDGVGRYIYGAARFGRNLDDVEEWMANDLGVPPPPREDDEAKRDLYTAFFAKYRDIDLLNKNYERFTQVLRNRLPSMSKDREHEIPRRIATPRFIASDSILWLQADGSETLIEARIGEPYQVDARTWACPAVLDAVDGRYPDIVGGSSLQALSLALDLIVTRLGHMFVDNAQLVYPEDRTPWDPSSLAALRSVE